MKYSGNVGNTGGQPACDLHVHTVLSDASRTVRQVMDYARQIGLSYIAITDHDTLAGTEEALELGEEYGIRVIPGTEISTRDENTGRTVHMLCYRPKDRAGLQSFLDVTLENRRRQKLAIAANVQKKYPLVTPALVEEYARQSQSIYECHIMQILCDLGYTSTAIGDLMSSLISSKGSCFVPGKYPTTREAARAIRDCGGIAVVAHAEQFDSFALVEEYAARGWIGGVEVNHPRNGADSRKRLRSIAEKYNLLVTGGSDFHGQYAKNPHPLGACGCGEEEARRLEEMII